MANKRVIKFDSRIITAILYLVIGALFCIFRSASLTYMMLITGILFICYGALDLIRNFYYSGIFAIVCGVVLLVCGSLVVEIAVLILGVILILKGAIALVNLFKLSRPNVMAIIGAAVTILVGVMLILNKWLMLDWFFIVIGIILILDGFLILIGKY